MNAEHDNRRRGTFRRAGTIVTAWLAGGLLVVGVLLASGALGGGSTTEVTTVKHAAATTPVADTSGGDTTADEALYESTSPGVVEIKSVISASSSSSGEGASPFGEAEGYGAPEGFGRESESSESTATGSGFIVDEEGTVVTAAHVVDEASSVKVILQDGTVCSAEVLGVDDATDIAVIRFDPEGIELQPLELGDSSSLKVGASVAAIGAPFEYAWSFSTGIVSGLDRDRFRRDTAGAQVAEVVQGSPAAEAGLQQGDVITALGEESIASTEDLVAAIAAREPGETVTLEVERDSQKDAVKVTLGTQPAESGR